MTRRWVYKLSHPDAIVVQSREASIVARLFHWLADSISALALNKVRYVLLSFTKLRWREKWGRWRSGGDKECWRVSGRVKRLRDLSGQSLLHQGTTKGDFFFFEHFTMVSSNNARCSSSMRHNAWWNTRNHGIISWFVRILNKSTVGFRFFRYFFRYCEFILSFAPWDLTQCYQRWISVPH
jgi:hypothetical protein